MISRRFLFRAVIDSKIGSRFVFTSSKPDNANPNWLRVGLAFGTSAFIWGLVNNHIISFRYIVLFELFV
ncbi:hypothetical protein INR49_024658 [Caranx melampygus]|nr:hypothetical protein INR49_024658 [Caranx melampygus]